MDYKDYKELILGELDQSLSAVNGQEVREMTEMILKAEKVFVTGVGRVFMMMEAFAKRLNHLGIEAYCVGDVNEPAVTKHDVLIAGSGAGESIIPLELAKKAKQYGTSVIHIGSNAESSMSAYEDLFVRIPCRTKLHLEDEIESAQIMSSLFEQSLLLLLDAAALMIMQEKKIEDIDSLWEKHANLE